MVLTFPSISVTLHTINFRVVSGRISAWVGRKSFEARKGLANEKKGKT